MAQGKCNLLKPVENPTGTFFMFSQYTQDLTKQYTQSDKWRCIPSKFAAMDLDLTTLGAEPEKKLGEIFQNYYENACTFLRGDKANEDNWKQEYCTFLLFQTLQKYGLMSVTDDLIKDNNSNIIGGVSKQLQYIGDINLYSYEELKDSTGYNEIYCYIPNDAKCKDYLLSAMKDPLDAVKLPEDMKTICGYEGYTPYNNLSWSIDGYTDASDENKLYSIGKYGDNLDHFTLVPQILDNHNLCYAEDSDDKERKAYMFSVNSIIVFYDIVTKNGADDDQILHQNIPLGIYFTGKPSDGDMTNMITKYVSSEEVYNQGTSYGLRICTRFLSHPNTIDNIEVTTTGSSNVSEIAPLLEKMGEVLASVHDTINSDDKMYDIVKEHLANFKNNRVNVPYVRQVGTKKYWFVNGKNTGAIAQFEMAGMDDIIEAVLKQVLNNVYTKDEVNEILKDYVPKSKFEQFATKEDIDKKIDELKKSLEVYLQSE